ncbi:MAG TPA: DUF2267 domain-containing protein [Herpetosiphonaceae bacterium]
MTQHENPHQRTPQESATTADPQTYPGASGINKNIGATSGHHNAEAGAEPSTEESGRDPARAQAIDQAQNEGKLPPPASYRPDTVVRAVGPDARIEMERGNDFRNEASFTKGHNAPTADQTRLPYTTEQMDEYLRNSPRGIFPNTPGGAGATPLSASRNTFIDDVTRIGHFPSRAEAEKWTRAVFNALRHRAVETDDALATELASVVRVGEAPEVQVEEMMWGGDFAERYARMVCLLQKWTRQDFYHQLSEEVGETPDDPWIDAAVHSFFGALKRALGDDADRSVTHLGEMQEVWDSV